MNICGRRLVCLKTYGCRRVSGFTPKQPGVAAFRDSFNPLDIYVAGACNYLSIYGLQTNSYDATQEILRTRRPHSK